MMTRLATCLVFVVSSLTVGVLHSATPAHAMGMCEQVGGGSTLLGYSPKRQELAIAQWYEHCAETDVGEDRRSFRYVDIRDARNKLVRRFIADDTKPEMFHRYIAKRAPVEPKGKLAPYLKAGGFAKPRASTTSPGKRCVGSLHPLPAKIEAEGGGSEDHLEDSYAVRMKVKAGNKTVLWSTLFEGKEDGNKRTWSATLHFLPEARMLAVALSAPHLVYEPGDEGGIDQRVEHTDKVRVFAASRHKKLAACFPATPPTPSKKQ